MCLRCCAAGLLGLLRAACHTFVTSITEPSISLAWLLTREACISVSHACMLLCTVLIVAVTVVAGAAVFVVAGSI